ncbi:complex I NDUFA9 subunit family protein [Curvivirga sp.]|uniref:complex I NDUFA9 subunit family protein n=1 Tax=Curvivirga sp. TaxID=2856848 RepID=UPI003B5BA1A5
MAFNGKMIVVFGGSGFVGRYVVRKLAAQGWRVRVASRDPEAGLYLKTTGDVGQVTPVQANIRNEASVRAAIEGCDAVINLVGILYESGKQKFDEVQGNASAPIAKIAKECGVENYVHMSALGADANSKSKYAKSKAAGEDAVRAVYQDAVIVRPSVIFGPQDGFFNRFASMAATSPALPLIGGGKTKFQPVYVGDVAEVIVRGLEDKSMAGKTYELGGLDVLSLEEVYQVLLKQMGKHRGLVPMPLFLAKILGSVLSFLPVPPMTRDQMILLERDNVVSGDLPGLADLGIEPTTIASELPHYMNRYRNGGQYNPITPS